jgi:rRNA maturation RNase YbeY
VAVHDPTVEVVDPDGLGPAPGPVAALVRAVLEAEAATGAVVVAFVHEAEIEELNSRYRVPEATDVLSFGNAEAEERWPDTSAQPELGEIIVCPAVVGRYAIEEGVPETKQMGWTLVHGVLHLLGYDHETDQGEMRAREQELLAHLAPLTERL